MNEFRKRLGLQFFADGPEEVTEEPIEEPTADEPSAEPEAPTEPETPPQVDMRQIRDSVYAEVLRSMCAINPATNQPFANESEWTNYLRDFERQEQENNLRQQGIDPEVLNQAIAHNPTVQQANQIIQKAQQQEGERALQAAVAEIGKLDSNIKSVQDLFKMDTFRQFDDLVHAGYSLVHAYQIANYDNLMSKRSEAAKQATLNSVNGKGHLSPTRGGAGDSTVIPQDTLNMYRRMFPDKDDNWILGQYKQFKE